MTAHVSVYIDKSVPLTVKLNNTTPGRPFATIDLDDKANTYIVVRSRADAKRLMAAAAEALDLLPEPESPASPLPPATHCPICGGKLDATGQHVTRSGARIEAGPLRAGTLGHEAVTS